MSERTFHLPPTVEPFDFGTWRYQLLTRMIRVFAVIGFAALVPGVMASLEAGMPIILIVDVVAYAALFAAYLLRTTHYNLAAGIVVVLQFCVGATLVFTVGTEGAAMLWLLASVLVANLIVNRLWSIVLLGVSIVILAVVGVLLSQNALPWTLKVEAWYAIAGSYVAIAVVIVFSSRFLLDRLSAGLAREQELNHELDHRVKNNLQLMTSLIKLQQQEPPSRETDGVLAQLGTQIQAMSAVFRLLDRSTGQLMVPFSELLTLVTEETVSTAPLVAQSPPSVTRNAGIAEDPDVMHAGVTRPTVTVESERGPSSLSVDTAVPVALVVAELISCVVALGTSAVTLIATQDRSITDLCLSATVPAVDSARAPRGADRGVGNAGDLAFVGEPLRRRLLLALADQLSGSLTEEVHPDGLRLHLRFSDT